MTYTAEDFKGILFNNFEGKVFSYADLVKAGLEEKTGKAKQIQIEKLNIVKAIDENGKSLFGKYMIDEDNSTLSNEELPPEDILADEEAYKDYLYKKKGYDKRHSEDEEDIEYTEFIKRLAKVESTIDFEWDRTTIHGQIKKALNVMNGYINKRDLIECIEYWRNYEYTPSKKDDEGNKIVYSMRTIVKDYFDKFITFKEDLEKRETMELPEQSYIEVKRDSKHHTYVPKDQIEWTKEDNAPDDYEKAGRVYNWHNSLDKFSHRDEDNTATATPHKGTDFDLDFNDEGEKRPKRTKSWRETLEEGLKELQPDIDRWKAEKEAEKKDPKYKQHRAEARYKQLRDESERKKQEEEENDDFRL